MRLSLSICREMTKRAQSTMSRESVKSWHTVAIEGNISSGKTACIEGIGAYSSVHTKIEPIDRWRNVHGYNLLELMYSDPNRLCLAFQSYVQLTMLQTHVEVSFHYYGYRSYVYGRWLGKIRRYDLWGWELGNPKPRPIKLMERSIYSAKYCFVESFHLSEQMSSVDYVVLSEWFNWIIRTHPVKLDLILYLRTRPEVVFERLKMRCRSEEMTISLLHLMRLHELYDDWLLKGRGFQTKPCPIVTIDANDNLNQVQSQCENAMLRYFPTFSQSEKNQRELPANG